MTSGSVSSQIAPGPRVRMNSALRASLSGMMLAFGPASAVLADETVKHQPEDPSRALETVTVTAPLNRAMEINAGAFGVKDTMDIPLSIQTYSADMIAGTSARTLMDVLALDSSVTSASYGGSFDNFRLRGFVIDNFNTIRRDGLALAPHHDFALENVERIDALKGPSGFLYGVNSPGGTVNYILKRPTREPLLNMTVQGTSLSGRYAAIDGSSSALSEKIGYRLNAAYEKNGDFSHARDMERKFAGLAADVRLGDATLLQVNGDWSWKSAVADPLLRADQSARVDPLDPASYVLPPEVERRDLLTGSWYRHRTEGTSVDAKLQVTLSPQWVSITQANHSRVERNGGYTDLFDIQPNGDIGFVDLYNSRGEIFTTYSVQSYLSGRFSTGGLSHDFFAGAAYKQFKDRSPFWDYVDSTGELGVSDLSVGNILAPTQPPEFDFGPEQPVDFDSDVREKSVFMSDLIAFNERIQALLGGRYIWYRAEHLSATAPPQRKDVFVPTSALIFRPTGSLMTYLSYARGFEKGDYAPSFVNNANQPTDAIESEQYEMGLKADLAAGIDVGLALFEIRRDASYVNIANDFVSDGTYRHHGVELNASGRFPRQFTATSTVAYLSTQLQDVADVTTLGKRSEGVPKWKGAIGARYSFAAVPGLVLDGTFSYTSNRPVDAQNSGFISGYSLLDAGVSYETKLGTTPIAWRLHGKNLTDKYYYAGAIFAGGLEVGRPREVFLSAQIKL